MKLLFLFLLLPTYIYYSPIPVDPPAGTGNDLRSGIKWVGCQKGDTLGSYEYDEEAGKKINHVHFEAYKNLSYDPRDISETRFARKWACQGTK